MGYYHSTFKYYLRRFRPDFLTLVVILFVILPLLPSAVAFFSDPKTEYRNFKIKQLAASESCSVSIAGDSVYLDLPNTLIQPDDFVCHKAASLFHSICSLDPNIVLHVVPVSTDPEAWVPSAQNPMSVTWTKQLISYYEEGY